MDLTRAVGEAVGRLARQPGVREVEVFAAFNRTLLARLNYTSHIPCNGVEEPKSAEMSGLGVQAVFDGPAGRPLVGFGSEPSDLTPDGALRALAKARQAAVHDPEFRSLARPTGGAPALVNYHDPRLMSVEDGELVAAGWQVIAGGLRAFMASGKLADLGGSEAGLKRLGLILGGDVTIVQSRVAIASSAMPEPQTDDSTYMSASTTGMVEARAAKGSGWSICARLEQFTDEAGAEAAGNAIAAMDGARVPSGDYPVIFGPQPVAELCSNLIVPSCHAGSFYSSSTPFLGRLGQTVAARGLSIYDHGAMPGLAGSRGVTCEGLPTGRTDLIKDGVLVGLLSHWYETQRMLHDPAARAKLGVDAAAAAAALVPRNGFRYDGSSGRSFDTTPGTSATNVVVEGDEPVSLGELAARVGNGLYVGRIWYTYPINGLRAGDFTCTVVGDSFIIRDGRIAAPLKANTVRINDNVTRLLGAVVGTTKDSRGTPLWGADEIVYAPAIAVSGVHVDAIAGFMEGLD
ncbi:MAG TPA: metallopeptidase TldD-related protein [Candidatus Deferrimicrobiaceae bacterium]|nr:metallopeptidase TldD-related protein [Candidatus Deferrimicrobiaceae bacterium]